MARARELAYQGVAAIEFQGAQHRTDIGADVVAFLAEKSAK